MTPSKMSMQGANLPPTVDVIYHEKLFERYTPSEIVEILKVHLGDDGIKLSSRKIIKDMIGLFGNSVFKKIHGGKIIDLSNVKVLIEEKYRIPEDERVDYCEFDNNQQSINL